MKFLTMKFCIFDHENISAHSNNSVCLYADGEKISCTPQYLQTPADTLEPYFKINFNDYNLTGTNVYAREFRLNWENDKCANIDELYIHYKDGKY